MSKELNFNKVVFEMHPGGEITRITRSGNKKRIDCSFYETFEEITSQETEILKKLVNDPDIKKIEFFYPRNN